MDLKVSEIQELAPVQFNYEEIKNWVTEKAQEYKSLVYTEENMATAKTDRATLNKVAKAINDEKIRVKKEFLKPFEDFESKCKELQTIISDASNHIDKQVKEYELKEQAEKEELIKNTFDSYMSNQKFKELVNFDTIFNPKWLNKTYKIKDIEKELNSLIIKINDDLDVIETQVKDENLLLTAKNYYFNNLHKDSVLGDTLKEITNKVEQEKKIKETLEKKEEHKVEEVEEEIMVAKFQVRATRTQLLELQRYFKEHNIEVKNI